MNCKVDLRHNLILFCLLLGIPSVRSSGTMEIKTLPGSTVFLGPYFQDTADNATSPSPKKEGDSQTAKEIKNEINKYFIALGMLFDGSKDSEDKSEAHGKNTHKTDSSVTVVDRKEVFGFHPHWLNTYREYNYKLLTSISYFSYELDPKTGSYETIYDWRTTPVVPMAKADSCKVYLTVTNFTEYKNRLFLKNQKAREKSIETISGLLLERRADGVTIDFENVPTDMRSQFTAYITRMSDVLEEQDMTVTMTLPPNYSSAFDIKALRHKVEFFVVMGKNYYGDWSEVAGPVSPLYSGTKWGEGSLAKSVTDYIGKGVPENKMILSLPYYGNKWELTDDSQPPKRHFFIENLKYQTIKNRHPGPPKYDTVSETAYLDIVSKKGKNIQIWFDDARTLAKKYDYIKQRKLAGVGIWALGYDSGYPELWGVLEEKFGGKTQKAPKNWTILSFLDDVRMLKSLKALLILVVFIFLAGFFLSLRNGAIRDLVLQHFWIKVTVLIGIPFLFLLLVFFKPDSTNGILIFLGVLLGYIIYYLFDRTEELDNNIKRIP